MKKTHSMLLLMTVFSSFVTNARITDEQTIYKIEKNILKIETKKNFHLNAQAPATVSFDQLKSIFKPSLKTESVFEFKILDGAREAKVNFYVCDDKKTVCEQHQEKISLTKNKASVEKNKNPEQKNLDIKTNLITNRLKDLISNHEKPTLLVFSAPWCPACIRMQTETYSQPKVKIQLKKVNLIKLNSDLPENSDLSDLFHVKAIPTMVLLNKNGEEVYRWIDFQQPNVFAKSLEVETKNLFVSKNSYLVEAALANEEAISKAGRMAYNSLNYEEAIKWLSLSKQAEDFKLKLSAEVSYWQTAAEKDEQKNIDYLNALQKGIFLTNSKIDQIRWTVDFIEKKKELESFNIDLKLKANQIISQINDILKNKKILTHEFKQSTFGEVLGFEEAELRLMQSRVYSALDEKKEKEKSDQAIIQLMKSKKVNVLRPGEMLMTIAYLREAGEKEIVTQYYEKLIQHYPKTYVYFEKYSRFLLKNKNFDLALSQVNESLKFTEGNEPQLLLLKSRILKELVLKKEMSETIESALNLKNIQHPRFKKTLEQLNKLKVEAQGLSIQK